MMLSKKLQMKPKMSRKTKRKTQSRIQGRKRIQSLKVMTRLMVWSSNKIRLMILRKRHKIKQMIFTKQRSLLPPK